MYLYRISIFLSGSSFCTGAIRKFEAILVWAKTGGELEQFTLEKPLRPKKNVQHTEIFILSDHCQQTISNVCYDDVCVSVACVRLGCCCLDRRCNVGSA